MVTAVGHLAPNSVLVSMEAPVARRLGNPARDRCHGDKDKDKEAWEDTLRDGQQLFIIFIFISPTLTKRRRLVPLEEPVGVEPAGGVGRAYEAVTTVTKELKPASRTEFGSVDHAPVHRRIVDATVGSWRHTGREHCSTHSSISRQLIIISASYCFTLSLVDTTVISNLRGRSVVSAWPESFPSNVMFCLVGAEHKSTTVQTSDTTRRNGLLGSPFPVRCGRCSTWSWLVSLLASHRWNDFPVPVRTIKSLCNFHFHL